MENFLSLVAVVLVCMGTFFSLVGVLGFFRFPDIYTRLHTTGKVGVFGVVFLLTASAVREDTTWGHALILIFFLIAAAPATAHTIASAAYRMGIKPDSSYRNDLPDIEMEKNGTRMSDEVPGA